MYHHFVLEEANLKKKAEYVPETSYTLFQHLQWTKSRKSVSLNGTDFDIQSTVYRDIFL